MATNPQIAALEAELANIQRGMTSGGPRGGGLGAAQREQQQWQGANSRQIDIANQLGRLRQSGGGAGGATDSVAEAQKRIQELTEGRAQEIQNDPYTTAALGYLQNVTSGQETPFNDQVQNAMLSRQADSTAAAESAQRQMLADQMAQNGGSLSDPAAQAAMRELSARRQQVNNGNLGTLQSQANIQNFNARMGGANQLAAVRGAQNAQVNQMNLAGAGYRAQTFQDVPTGGGGGGGFTTTSSARAATTASPTNASWGQPAGYSGMAVAPRTSAPRAVDMSGWTPAQRAAASAAKPAANSTASGYNANALNGVARTVPVGVPGGYGAVGYPPNYTTAVKPPVKPLSGYTQTYGR